LTRAALRAGVLTCRGEIQERLGANVEALALYDQAVSTAKSSPDDEMLAGALYSRGYLRGLQGRYAEALDDLRQSQKLYEKIGMSLHALTTVNTIATTYSRMGDHAQALAIYRDALQRQTAAGLRREQVVTEHNIGASPKNRGTGMMRPGRSSRR
jgi:tetratricopeptide (TPR) repeat protein